MCVALLGIELSTYPGLLTVATVVPLRITRYPVTPTLSVLANQVRLDLVGLCRVATSERGVLGAVVSGGGGTTTRTALAGPVFPAASTAATT